jgi:hypothetical protein
MKFKLMSTQNTDIHCRCLGSRTAVANPEDMFDVFLSVLQTSYFGDIYETITA